MVSLGRGDGVWSLQDRQHAESRPAQAVIGRLVSDPAGRLGLQVPLFRAPAACWCARVTVESTSGCSRSDGRRINMQADVVLRPLAA